MFRTKLRNIYLRNPMVENDMMFRKQRNYCVKPLKQTKKSYYGNLNINLITEGSFGNKMTTSSNFIQYDNAEIICNES